MILETNEYHAIEICEMSQTPIDPVQGTEASSSLKEWVYQNTPTSQQLFSAAETFAKYGFIPMIILIGTITEPRPHIADVLFPF